MPTEPLTRQQIDAKRAEGLERHRAANVKALARQDLIHALAYKLHQADMDDESLQEKPGLDKALEAATKQVDAAIAEAEADAAAAAQAEADAKAAADAEAVADAQAAAKAEAAAHAAEAQAEHSHEAASHLDAESTAQH